MGDKPALTRSRTTVPTFLALANWTDPVWRSAPSPADLRESVMRSSLATHRVRVVAAALAASAAVSAAAPALSAAQSGASSTSQDGSSADVTPWQKAKKRPRLTQESQTLAKKKQQPKRSSAKSASSSNRVPAVARYRVVAGQSLWVVARKRLGPNASNAAVYHYVVKVWNRNEIRIGTGDPDLIKVGTVLTLPATTKA